MTIINECTNSTDWFVVTTVAVFYGLALLGLISLFINKDCPSIAKPLLIIVAVLCSIVFYVVETNQNTYTLYEVTLDKTTSEFVDNYEIVDKNGDIYTIKEKK